MHTTPLGGRPSASFDFPVRFGDESAMGRLPLRQRWQLLGDSAPASAAPPLRDTVPVRSKFALIPQGAGGEIWALNERALREGRAAVSAGHGEGVRFGELQVHTYVDPVRRVPMEPLMFVKVNARREHLDVLLQQLRARGARMHEVELQKQRVVLRAEARLARLLGLEEAVLAVGRHSAQVFSWLVRYEPAAVHFIEE
jgi:hypothetical protein